ncbi:serine hydrolase domain-containing protein [Paenibacillus hodogayensis]|uniref:Serine hydrolase domain-containing protein n=1 Tax=Paenibacillus hodogayensis TaxID=279208 RepID=A0ABV5VVC1_9BACL
MGLRLLATSRLAAIPLFGLLIPALFLTMAGASGQGDSSPQSVTVSQYTYSEPWKQEVDLYLQQNGFNGTVLIAREGEVLFSSGYGKETESTTNSEQTVFRLMSMSKPFTATAIMQLEEQNRLELTDTLDQYVPDFLNGDQITIHHLLSHSSGIPRDFPRVLNATLQQTVDSIKSRSLDFTPGTQYNYSNSGYVVLASIIQTVSGQSYEQYMQDHLFGPLGMTHSGESLLPTDTMPHKAAGYRKNSAGTALIAAPFFVTQSGGGSLYSTVGDLLLWDRALYGNTVLQQSSIAKMFTPNLGNYGYGWSIRPKRGNVVVHNGSGNGFSTFIYRNLDSETLVVVLSNVTDVAAEQIGFDLAAKIPPG